MLRVFSLYAALLLIPAAIQAGEDGDSANWIMPGCRHMLAGSLEDLPKVAIFKVGACIGTVDALSFLAKGLMACPENGVTKEQALRVVAHYIDARPARLHEPFKVLVLEALEDAWPCRR